MKKTHKIIMGVTALAMAFSACALSACSGNKEPDGTIDGNYKVATAEEVNTALSAVKSETLLGDTTAEDYKFGIDFSSKLNLSMSTEGQSTSFSMNAGYKMLATAGESALSYKGAGNLSMNGSNTANDKTTTSEIALNLWQDDATLYANLTGKSSEDAEEQTQKIKLDASKLISSLLPSGGADVTDPTIPGSDVTNPDLPEVEVTTPDLSSYLVTVVNMLNEMDATTSLDTTNGIKLKISINQDVVNNLIAGMMGGTPEQVTGLVSFTKCSLDFYVAIDSKGMLSAASIVADVDATVNMPVSETATSTSTIKLNGYLYFDVDSTVNPEVPTSLKTDDTYFDITEMIGEMIGGMIGGGSLVG